MQEKIYPHFTVQAYQATVLLRKPQIHTVGTRYPFKDQVVITAQNIERSLTNPLYSVSSLIDVVIRCENQIEAKKLNGLLRDYFAKNLMLPLHVGVFQKPYTKDGQKAMKYYSFSNISAKELIEALPTYEKDASLKYVVGHSPVESNFLMNGFDLTYTLTNYILSSACFTLEQMKDFNKNADKPSYKLKLKTTSFYEVDEDTAFDESVDFEITGESESEIDILAEKITKLHDNGIPFVCSGRMPQSQKDFYTVSVHKRASDLIGDVDKLLKPVTPSTPDKKAS